MSGGALFDSDKKFYGTLTGTCIDSSGDGLFMVYPVFQIGGAPFFPPDISVSDSLQPFWSHDKLQQQLKGVALSLCRSIPISLLMRTECSQTSSIDNRCSGGGDNEIDAYKSRITRLYRFDGDPCADHVRTEDICAEVKRAMTHPGRFNVRTCQIAICALYGRKPQTAFGASIGNGCRGWVARFASSSSSSSSLS